MIQLKRKDSRSYSFAEACVDVTFRIPDAAEAETVIADQIKDTEIFKQFAVEIKSRDIEGWGNGVSAEEVVGTPGTLSLIRLVAFDIVKAMSVGAERKN